MLVAEEFVMSEDKEKNEGWLKHSEVESQRFGFNVYRGVLDTIDPKTIASEIIQNKVDLAIVRVPCEQQATLAKLERCGFPFIVSDTLVYYHCDLSKYEPAELRNQDLEFVEFEVGHFAVMDELVEEIFADYKNHYSSNPLTAGDLMDGYKEWACSYVTKSGSGKRAWLVRRNGKFIAFATCSFEQEKKESEGVLFGVSSAAAGGGVYGDLIRFTQRFFKEHSYIQMKVSTQIQNYAVQKVWSREGFALKSSLLTLHINALMNHSLRPVDSIPIEVTTDEIDHFGELSGDLNPLHFDDDFARQHRLESRIAHGLIANSHISKYFGTVFPGAGTIFLGYSFKFFAPIYPGRVYRTEYRFPTIVADQTKGIYKATVQIFDGDNLCLIAYTDLFRRELQTEG